MNPSTLPAMDEIVGFISGRKHFYPKKIVNIHSTKNSHNPKYLLLL